MAILLVNTFSHVDAIEGSQFTRIFTNFTSLNKADLSDLPLLQVTAILHASNSLESLICTNSKSHDNELIAFANVIKYNTVLKHLRINYPKFSLELCNAFAANQSITSFYISNSNEKKLEEFILRIKNLKVLGISYIFGLSEQTIASFLPKLHLESLELRGVDGNKMIFSCLKDMPSLKKFKCSSLNIDSAKLLGEIIMTNTTLTELGLPDIYSQDESLALVDETLMFNTTITALTLSNNNNPKVIKEICKKNIVESLEYTNEINFVNEELTSCFWNYKMTSFTLSGDSIDVVAREVFDVHCSTNRG
jgi:hypothetical protein